MKKLKTLIAIGAIIVPVAISARSLSPDEAKQIAADFIQQKESTFRPSRSAASAPLRLTLANTGGKISRSSSPAYYIFNVADNNGYVIVSGDDSFHEILGYANSGNYLSEKSNPSMDYWLSRMAEEMANPPAKNDRQSRSTFTMTEVSPLLTTTWSQNEPYNNDCWVESYRPTIGQEPQHAPTGCVATAMAQVMNYHKWPQSYNDFEYKWDLMLPSYNGSESPESIDQVAKLMSHCGKAVNMSYGTSASSAADVLVVPALVKNFGYDGEKIQMLNRNSYGYERIHTILNTELKENRPIIVGGEYPNSDMGHEFIFDGCTSDGFFHVNWGWGGYLDGYFRLTSLRPEDYGTGGAQEGYSFNVSLITGIQPNKNIDETAVPTAKLTALGDLSLSDEDSWTSNYREWMSLYFSTRNGTRKGFMNVGAEKFSGSIFTKWTNTATGTSTLLGETNFTNYLSPGYYTSGFSLSFSLSDLKLNSGDKYEMSLVYRLATDAEDVYRDIEFSFGSHSSITVERIGDELKFTHHTSPVILKAELPTLGDRVQIKANQSFTANITNTSDSEYVGEVRCRFKDSDGNFLDRLTDYLMLDLLPGEKITEDLTLYNLGNANPGTYTVGLYDFRNNLISEEKTVELYEFILPIDETYFPDPIFRDYISSQYDLDKNGTLSSAELNNATTIQVRGLGITDFKGCELLPNLSFVEIVEEKCTTLDLSTAGPFYYLGIQDTPLETITLGDRKSLMYCNLYGTNLKELDLTGCSRISNVSASNNNQLEKLSVNGLANLYSLSCWGNNLSELDLTGCSNLTELFCSSNNLTAIDLSGQCKLTYLDLVRNKLTGKLDVSSFKDLEYLTVWDNELSELVLGDHPNIKSIDVDGNKLTGKLDISNYSSLESCSANRNYFDEFVSGDNKALTGLWLSDNQLKGRLDVSALENLEGLHADNNSLEEIILKNAGKLQVITLNNNKLTGKMDLSSCGLLTSIQANNNKLSELLLGKHPNLDIVSAYNNSIEGTLDFSNCPAIKHIYLSSNQIGEVILSNNSELLTLDIPYNKTIAGTLDISGAPNLQYLNASDNKISNFKYDRHPNLTSLYISENCLTHFHVEDFPSVASWSISYSDQKANITIDTPNFNLKTLSSTGFDPRRASEWWMYWYEGVELKSQEVSSINDVLVIPEEAGRDVKLEYKYLTDVASNRETDFTINLTREGLTAIDDITADSTGEITVEGNTIHTATDCLKEIFNLSGQCIYRGTDESISLDGGRGIYLIRISGKTFKVII